jgi:hypothetical protein
VTPDFRAYPKTPRFRREVIITEKIDGTNAAIGISHDTEVWAQSRNRIIQPGDDNYGFAAWVMERAPALASILGPGLHFGEWWGSGIQRGYGLTRGEKRFSLFNVVRWEALSTDVIDECDDGSTITANDVGVYTVPVLAQGVLDDALVELALDKLRVYGSYAAPGYMNPEGICIFHTASRQTYKVLIDKDDQPKSAA